MEQSTVWPLYYTRFQNIFRTTLINGQLFQSSHDDLAQDAFYAIVLSFCFFDTFALMYLGNEIMLSSDGLSYCLFESTWTEQTQSCKMCIIIMVERLKQPQQLVVGILFSLDLESFSIVS